MVDITLLDGGMGQELIRRSGDTPTPLWATQVMVDHPCLVSSIHRDYRNAGATVAMTNTYALHRDRLVGTALADRFAALYNTALTEAEAACAGHGRIAGAIGPLVASYRPDIHPPAAEAIPLYTEVAKLLAPRVDLIICETVASVDHARSVLAAALPTGKPVWLALTVKDRDGTRLRSGEKLTEVLPHIKGASALLVNCTSPESVTTAMEILPQGGLPFGGYANGFVEISSDFLGENPTVDSLSARSDLSPEGYAQLAMEWIAMGATIVGGCCEVRPQHIATLAHEIRKAGHTIV
ncbi:homocysteine S-methyltransferase family protein [Loktanella sp. S4079]|uniref:homocysteine S-methyltransferase family protein n=1 Tax=Loktanella sp. S4079 TaxID=579483 RepID=UPI0005FA7957|nr:homocysteine S-methyltransferase family protein [Loktanella sp. S4079]KJZ18923.1 homocysteine methyltransferase [Loktanella sp. S4079]